MIKKGVKASLVRLINAKTKIKPIDISDMLDVLPECMAEAFIMANPAENENIDMGGVSVQWRTGNRWGPFVAVKTSKTFKAHFTKLRFESTYFLAKKLFALMHPKSKERVLEKAGRGGYNDKYV